MSQRIKVRTLTAFTSQGTRPCQEDHILANRERGIFALADGFGGPQVGDAAAQEACGAIMEFLQREAGDEEATFPFIRKSTFSLAGNILFNAVVHANRKVLKRNKGKPIHERGGASALAVYMDGETLSIANVGVCSAWLLREGRWAELAAPRSYARMCDPFAQNPEESLCAPLVCLGIAEDLEPEIVEYRVKPGDLVLLQTDGVGWEIRELVERIHASASGPSEAARQSAEALQGTEKERRFSDNMALLLVNF